METTIQLYAKHTFHIPLPDLNQPVHRCRECGGIINGEGITKEYSPAWAMEGYIFSENKTICPACYKATQGTQTKALITPFSGTAVVIHKDGLIPAGLESFNIKEKKETLHKDGLSIKEAIQKIPELPVPYAIYACLGNPTKVSNNFLKDVPMNYSNRVCLLYLVPAMITIKVDVDTIFDKVAEMRNKLDARVKELTEAKKNYSEWYLFNEIYQEYNLSKSQKRFYYYLLTN